MNKIQFSPLKFLASLGAGGIAISPFALMQYSVHKGSGLINISHLDFSSMEIASLLYFSFLFLIMIVFTFIHFYLLINYTIKYLEYKKTSEYQETLNNPLKNGNLATPFIAVIMSLNVFIGPVRFFIPYIANNLQLFMLPALLVWSFIWILLLSREVKLLKITFSKSFNLKDISFSWLLHVFALAMLSVTGSGIAAMAKDVLIAKTAAMLTIISLTMGLFLFTIKLTSIFLNHFEKSDLPQKQFLPSFLIVIPIITLFSITGFRLVHFMEVNFDFHLHFAAFAIVVFGFAFEIWYGFFGLSLLKKYFKEDFFKKEYYISQWGLVCPVVAFGVLGSFFYKLFQPGEWFIGLEIVVILLSAVLFFILLQRNLKCRTKSANQGYSCIE